MANIDIEKIILSLIERSSGLTQQIFYSDLLNALKEQGLEYKNGKIVKIQRRIAAEAKEALYTPEVDIEDERMKNAAIRACKYMIDNFENSTKDYEDAIAWLEKQKYTQRDVDDAYLKGVTDTKNELEKQGEQNPADKVEPKFKIEKDNWYVCIRDLDDDYGTRAFRKGDIYYSTKDETLMPDNSNVPYEIKYCVEHYFHLWTIQDSKDGDVLAAQECYVIFKEIDGLNIKCYCTYHYMGFNPSFYINTLQNKTAFHPATKEQCDLLFQKMKEAGYEWDAEKKELNQLSQSEVTKTSEQVWSEEDERMYKIALSCIETLEDISDGKNMHADVKDWLKSLKYGCIWKPTKEHVKAVRLARSFVTDDFGEHPMLSETLIDLEEQLKKLREE